MAERITGHTELIGLIATPIRHSMSPTMHNEAFAHLGLDYVYLAFEVGNQELKDVVQGFRAMKLRGFNVSMPNKTEICQYLDKLSPAAQLVGAVNTVVNDDGVLTGAAGYSATGYSADDREVVENLQSANRELEPVQPPVLPADRLCAGADRHQPRLGTLSVSGSAQT